MVWRPRFTLHGFRYVEVVARALPMLRAWVASLGSTIEDGVVTGDKYGDWCAPPADRATSAPPEPRLATEGGLIATAYLYRCLTLLMRFAAVLGEEATAARGRADRVAHAFDRRFRRGNSYGSPTGAVLALAFDLVPVALRQPVADWLAADIGPTGAACTGLIGSQ